MTTRFQQHVARWRDCDRCLLSKHRSRVVIARGRVPAEVLFVGEAPGASEDVVGLPFVGPAGRLLDNVISASLDGQFDYALTNLVCCIPRDEANGKGEPPKDAIQACRPRLEEFIELCSPRLIVCVGHLSVKHLPQAVTDGCAVTGILHPAAILRMDASQQPLAIKRCVVAIESAVESYL